MVDGVGLTPLVADRPFRPWVVGGYDPEVPLEDRPGCR